ncbi:hypothetical protein HNP99_002986 [Flavobacterium sp. 28A]|uniref:hypothetical protein n=1 Tax=Flavobacterium sp. 28A TaxID=2735895 RepID=UPI00157015AA|nr:hypothetical protein [Flavobacterium sp. 28A]NRT16615.1 hypothetical protein [Flavobacterium sp. 28A]
MMNKKILAIIVVAIVIFSCEKSKKQTPETNENSQSQELVSKKIDIKELKGSGFEPGWSILISQKNKRNFSFELLTLLGQQKTTGTLYLESDFIEEQNAIVSFKGTDTDGKEITVTYLLKSCLDMAGNETGGIIDVKWNEEQFNGCGNYLINYK